VHHDKVERVPAIAGTFDHLLEAGAPIVAGGRACFDEFGYNFVPIRAAPGKQLATLIRD
jgi:hypothetical protein